MAHSADLASEIAVNTGIPLMAIQHTIQYDSVSVAERISWLRGRKTSRSEDSAYCLLGICEVNLPLLYGEGGPRAFQRLLHAILAQSTDESIFAVVGGFAQGVDRISQSSDMVDLPLVPRAVDEIAVGYSTRADITRSWSQITDYNGRRPSFITPGHGIDLLGTRSLTVTNTGIRTHVQYITTEHAATKASRVNKLGLATARALVIWVVIFSTFRNMVERSVEEPLLRCFVPVQAYLGAGLTVLQPYLDDLEAMNVARASYTRYLQLLTSGSSAANGVFQKAEVILAWEGTYWSTSEDEP
jgi:hypothetical protein